MASVSDIPSDLRAAFEAAGQGHVFKFVDNGIVSLPSACFRSTGARPHIIILSAFVVARRYPRSKQASL